MNVDQLKPFCADADDPRPLHDPFSQGDFTYATDGHVIVRVPRIEGLKEQDKPVGIDSRLPWDHDDLTEWAELPKLDISLQPECDYCGGPEPDCRFCRGTGRVIFNSSLFSIEWHGAHFAFGYLQLISSLPGLLLQTDGQKDKPWRFKFDGGVGLLMPMANI